MFSPTYPISLSHALITVILTLLHPKMGSKLLLSPIGMRSLWHPATMLLPHGRATTRGPSAGAIAKESVNIWNQLPDMWVRKPSDGPSSQLAINGWRWATMLIYEQNKWCSYSKSFILGCVFKCSHWSLWYPQTLTYGWLSSWLINLNGLPRCEMFLRINIQEGVENDITVLKFT